VKINLRRKSCGSPTKSLLNSKGLPKFLRNWKDMTNRFPLNMLLAGLVLMTFGGFTFAQEAQYQDIIDAKPMFKTLPNHLELAPSTVGAAGTTALTLWNGSFIDLTKRKITYTMVGTNPAVSNVSTTIPVYIIPIKMVYGSTNGNRTFDPLTAKASNGLSVVKNIIASPIFKKGVNFTQGSTNLGATQYVDAFQRGNFWEYVHTHTGYHVLLGAPTVLPEQTIKVASTLGSVLNNPFGTGFVGTYDIFSFDSKLQTIMKNFTQIHPGVLPLFITYDIYLTEGGCCIGGYHSANGIQPGGKTYAYATYVGSPGAFSQNVSAISHEIGEWMDDPFVNNKVHCTDNNVLEVGDPLENRSNYGAFPYTLNGFTYDLQSLVFIGYFGAPRATSVHSWLAFQNDESSVCPGQ
jgi:hypothetical protein